MTLVSPRAVFSGLALCVVLGGSAIAEESLLELRPHDRIALVGNSLAERMRLYGNFEAWLHMQHRGRELVVRNFGWPGDAVGVQQRPNDYTALDDPLDVFSPNVLLCFFGHNESAAGSDGLQQFGEDLADYLRTTTARFTKDGRAPRVVLISPVAFERTGERLLPPGRRENANSKLYTEAMGRVAEKQNVPFIDLFTPTLEPMSGEGRPRRTINGLHLNEAGDALVAQLLMERLFAGDAPQAPLPDDGIARLKEAVVDLQWHHQQDYRMVNGWYVYGSRSRPLDVDTFRPEYAKVRKMCADRDRVVWALAHGDEPPAIDDAEPVLAEVPTTFGSKPYSEPAELRLLTAAEAEKAMTPAKGYRVETFASEEQFPELAKPVQMNFDNRGRLWASCMPTYPQWRPGDPKPKDRLLIFEDTDADGKADVCKVFAEGLHCPVGFEFWNGGVLVHSQPKLVFLKDTDGDDKADVREVMLDGFATDDTHHACHVFEWTPDGRLIVMEGISMSTTIETPWGPLRNHNSSAAYTIDPQAWKFELFITPLFANPWCYTHNDWGQGFVGDGTGAQQHWATPLNGKQFAERGGNQQFISYEGPTMRPALGNGFIHSRHFPESAQGNFFFACVINMNGILQFTVEESDSGYLGRRIEDLVTSTDRNFRPGDAQIGPDGALYFLDWHNPLIGHMQYSQRDPNRDHTHGRIYRMTAEGRPLVKPVAQAGKSVPELLAQLREYEVQTRYRVRRELRDRPTREVASAVKKWVGSIAADDPLRDQLLVEAMYVLAGQRVVDDDLYKTLLAAKTPDARAAAVHMLADQRLSAPLARDTIAPFIDDPHPRVRLEAVRAMSFFPDVESVKLALSVLEHPMDPELTYTLESTMGALRPVWTEAEKNSVDLAAGSAEAQEFMDRIAAGGRRGRRAVELVKVILEKDPTSASRASALAAALVALRGDGDDGAKVFKRACQACHKVGTDGADFGPNLSDVGKRLKREEIVESILFPNAKIEPKYRATNIVTVEGKALSGLVVKETSEEIELLLGQGTIEKIPTVDVEIRQEVDVSSMPDRLNETMSGRELLDLLSFLAGQKTAPTPPPDVAAGGSSG